MVLEESHSRLSSEDRGPIIGLGKGRLESLTDGIFGTVMTVLVLSLSVPIIISGSPAFENSQLITSLRGLLPDIFSYIISFAILGSFWVRHHTMFFFVTTVNRILLGLNIAFLLTIGFIPFSTALLGLYPTLELSLIIYGMNLIATSIASQILWIYAVRKKLVSHDTIDERNISRITRRMTLGWLSYVIAIFVSFIDPLLTLALYIITLLFFIFNTGIGIRIRRPKVPKSEF